WGNAIRPARAHAANRRPIGELSMNHSSQIRRTKDEGRTNDKIRMTKPANAPLKVFRHSGFGFLSSFVIQRPMQFRFLVRLHAKNRKETLHEAERRGPARRGAACPGCADTEIGAPSPLFKVP